MTEMGMILGTAAYMSPEQAKGRQADKRSDVWAFGAVLYEMLSGHRAFKGDDVSDTLASVLRQEIDWTALPPSTPASVRHLIARCLDRDVRRRLRDIGEARIALDDPAALAEHPGATPPPSRFGRRGPCGDARWQSCSPQSWPVAWQQPPRGTSNHRRRPPSLDSNSPCRKDSPSRASAAVWLTSRRTARRWCTSRMAGCISERCQSETRRRFKAPKAIKPWRVLSFRRMVDRSLSTQPPIRRSRGFLSRAELPSQLRSRHAVRHELGARGYRLRGGQQRHQAGLPGWRRTGCARQPEER